MHGQILLSYCLSPIVCSLLHCNTLCDSSVCVHYGGGVSVTQGRRPQVVCTCGCIMWFISSVNVCTLCDLL